MNRDTLADGVILRSMVPPPKSSERILAHISTDKPYYMPGETVWVETYLIDSITKLPKFSSQNIYATCVILDSFNTEVFRS